MQQRFDINKAPQTLLRAEPRPIAQAGHIRGVEATAGGLVRSSLIASAAAIGVLTLFYLPAEYGIDATGLGGVLGLTEMGQIKQQLYAEAAGEDAAAASSAQFDPVMHERLGVIEAQLAAIAAAIGADTLVPVAPATALAPVPEPGPVTAAVAPPAEAAAPEPAASEAVTAAVAEAAATPGWRDEVSYTLAAGEGIEVKLVMDEGETARFEWTANGAVVNYDTHGDGGGNKVSYETGRGVPDQTGELTAAFTGNHGWFWRNRTEAPLTVTLRTAGDYAEMKRP